MKKQKKLDEIARGEIEAEGVVVHKEFELTSHMLAELPEVSAAQEFKQLLNEATGERHVLESQLETDMNDRERKLQARLRKRRKNADGKDVDEDKHSTVKAPVGEDEDGASHGGARANFARLFRAVSADLRFSHSMRSAGWETDALERAKLQAKDLEKKRQEALLAAKKEHQKDMQLLENQLQEEMDLKENHLRARLEKRKAKAKRHKSSAVSGPPMSSCHSQSLSSTVSIETVEHELEREISKLKVRLPCFVPSFLDALPSFLRSFLDLPLLFFLPSFLASSLKVDFAQRREKVLREQNVRLADDARLVKANVEIEAAEAVERAQLQQLVKANELEVIRENHKKETASLLQDMEAQQKLVDERLKAKLAKRKKVRAHKQPQSGDSSVDGPAAGSLQGPPDPWADPEIVKLQAELAERKDNLKAMNKGQFEKEREHREAMETAQADAIAAACALKAFKGNLFKSKKRALAHQNSSRSELKTSGTLGVDRPKPVDDERSQLSATLPSGSEPGEHTADGNESMTPAAALPGLLGLNELLGGVNNELDRAESTLRSLILLENHTFSEEQCLVLEEFSRMVRKNRKA